MRLDPSMHTWQPEHFGATWDLICQMREQNHHFAACVCCSDVGGAPESASFVEPGQLFVIQNAGACVSVDGQTTIDSIDYALCQRGIEHLIVCGHFECRLMQGFLAPAKDRPLTLLEKQLATELAPVVLHYTERTAETLPAVVAQEHVLSQLELLVNSETCGERLAQGRLKLYGWIVDDRTAKVFGFNAATGQFDELRRPSPR